MNDDKVIQQEPEAEPVEMSVVIPAKTPFTDLPKSANPPMKNANPEIPFDVFNSGISRDGPEPEPVGIFNDNLGGIGSISAKTERGRSSEVGAFPTLIKKGSRPSNVANAVPIPEGPCAPSSKGGIQPTSLIPEIDADSDEVWLLGSWWNKKWSPFMERGLFESLSWASILPIGNEDENESTASEVVENESGSPVILAACLWKPSEPVYTIDSIGDDAEYSCPSGVTITEMLLGRSDSHSD